MVRCRERPRWRSGEGVRTFDLWTAIEDEDENENENEELLTLDSALPATTSPNF